MKQADMDIDGGGVVGGYGAQDGSEAEMLGKGDLQPVAVSLALDGVLLSVVHIVVVRVDDPRLHNGVGLREAFVGNGIISVFWLYLQLQRFWYKHFTDESK